MTETCNICKRLLDDPKDPTTENCGGDCLRCMAEFAEDPDCMTPYIRILKTENEALRQSAQSDVLKAAGDAIRGLLDITSDYNLDSEQAGRAYAALHDIDTALKGQSK